MCSKIQHLFCLAIVRGERAATLRERDRSTAPFAVHLAASFHPIPGNSIPGNDFACRITRLHDWSFPGQLVSRPTHKQFACGGVARVAGTRDRNNDDHLSSSPIQLRSFSLSLSLLFSLRLLLLSLIPLTSCALICLAILRCYTVQYTVRGRCWFSRDRGNEYTNVAKFWSRKRKGSKVSNCIGIYIRERKGKNLEALLDWFRWNDISWRRKLFRQSALNKDLRNVGFYIEREYTKTIIMFDTEHSFSLLSVSFCARWK